MGISPNFLAFKFFCLLLKRLNYLYIYLSNVVLAWFQTAMWLGSDMLRSLVYWENPRDSGLAFGPVLVCLLAVRYISLISVLGNLALALVTATVSFR